MLKTVARFDQTRSGYFIFKIKQT